MCACVCVCVRLCVYLHVDTLKVHRRDIHVQMYRMAGNCCGVLIFVIFVVYLAVTKISIHEN